MMELTDYTVYLWLWPVAVHLLLPLAVACLGLGIFVIKRVGTIMVDRKEASPHASSA